MNRVRELVANPWRQHRFLAVWTWMYLLWAIVPVIIAIAFSFNASRSRSAWQGLSLRWWSGDPDLSLLHNPLLTAAIRQSLVLAALTMVIATPIGIALALGLARWRGRGSGGANFLMLLPLVTPEIVIATGLFLVFVFLYPWPNVGTTAQVLGHVTWSIPYVVVVLRGRIFGVGPELEEAAMDLGASPVQAMRRALLPVLSPAIFAAFMIVFALSIDDFVTSQFLSSGEATQTVPMLIYSAGRTAPNPALNATATLMLVISLGAIGLGLAGMRWLARRQGLGSQNAADVARFELR
jgi:spermidine/putrescine transport system permease protein